MDINHIINKCCDLPEHVDYFNGLGLFNFSVPTNCVFFFRDKKSIRKLHYESNFHNRHILIISLGDPVAMIIDGTQIQLNMFETILILPYQHHRYQKIQNDINFSLLFITFDIEENTYLERFRNIKFHFNDLDLLEICINAYNQKDTNVLPFHMGALISKIISSDPIFNTFKMKSKNDLIKEICRRIYRQKNINIKKLSQDLNFSEVYLRKEFKKTMNTSLGQYIIEIRLSDAIKNLIFSDKTITEIALLAGYDSIYAFSKIFKKHIGIPPSEVRKIPENNEYLTAFKKFLC